VRPRSAGSSTRTTKGWIKPANIKEGKRRGEWDAFVRDMTAEDACNEEGIDSVEEAAEALS
jgi:hypothetical protein